MEQKTYEQVLASIDPERARRAVANSVIYLGGLLDWGSDEFCAVQEELSVALTGSGLPSFGDQDADLLKFWGTLSLAAGNDCDYDPDEQDEEPVSPANDKRVVFYANESFYDRESGTYVVARIVEDEPGYEVWSRHATVGDAQYQARLENNRNGVGDNTVLDVVASSMRASNLHGR